MEEKDLLDRANRIRKGYSSIVADEEEEQLSFLDELNALVRTILKDDPVDIYTLLTPEELDKWRRARTKRYLSRMLRRLFSRSSLYFILLATITGFLVTEALPFYAIAGVVSTKTWVKAILTEVCFIFLSGYRSVGRWETSLISILRASLFCLMLFVISSETTLEGVRDASKISNISSRIELLQDQINSTKEDIETYRQKDWPKNMTVSIRKREKLEEEVIKLKEKQLNENATEEQSFLVKMKAYGKAFFRFILMMVSVVVTRRIFKF